MGPEQWRVKLSIVYRLKQLGAAFSGTRTRLQILVGPINSKQWFITYQTTDTCGST